MEQKKSRVLSNKRVVQSDILFMILLWRRRVYRDRLLVRTTRGHCSCVLGNMRTINPAHEFLTLRGHGETVYQGSTALCIYVCTLLNDRYLPRYSYLSTVHVYRRPCARACVDFSSPYALLSNVLPRKHIIILYYARGVYTYIQRAHLMA